MEFQNCEMCLRDEQIFVVTMIADQCKSLRAARQVVAEFAFAGVEIFADQQLWPVFVSRRRVPCVKMRTAVGTEAVDTVEVETWSAEILDAERILLLIAK